MSRYKTISAEIPPSPIVCYDFSDITSYPGSGNTVFDKFKSTNATLINNPTFSAFTSGSLYFDGTDDFLITNTSLNSKFYGTSPNKSEVTSIFMWVYPMDNGVILSEQGTSPTPNTGWFDSQIEMVGGVLNFGMWNGVGISSIVSSVQTPFNEWYHVGMVYNGSNLTAYVNGFSAGTITFNRLAPYNSSTNLYYAIGSECGTNMGDGSYAKMYLSRFEVYNVALTNNQINYIYKKTKNIIPEKFIAVGSVNLFGVGKAVGKFDSEGNLDINFLNNTPIFAGGSIFNVKKQKDGKLLLGGDFTSPTNRLVRLNPDGTTDTTFSTNIGTGGGSRINMGVQSDNKIVLTVSNGVWNGITYNARIIRLNENGTLDSTFTNSFTGSTNAGLQTLRIQSNDKILIGSNTTTTFNGVSVGKIFRLNSDGTLDNNFKTNVGINAGVFGMGYGDYYLFDDEKILSTGTFSTFNGTTNKQRHIILNNDGTTFSDFSVSGVNASTPTTNLIWECKFDPSINNFYSTGNSRITKNSVIHYGFFRLLINGEVDATFTAGTKFGPVTTTAPYIYSNQPQKTGKILVGVNSLTTTYDSIPLSGSILRFNQNGTLDNTFSQIGASGQSTISIIKYN